MTPGQFAVAGIVLLLTGLAARALFGIAVTGVQPPGEALGRAALGMALCAIAGGLLGWTFGGGA